uniref:Chitin-binding type-2 domain-containing protein n=1 Tax=Timema cristinae TaxID=61476 RepID=A0A7R9D672_TIMCR|nr:unnamed protein product [Timema cristinae]
MEGECKTILEITTLSKPERDSNLDVIGSLAKQESSASDHAATEAVMSGALAGHYYNADGTPHDPYHELHLPHDPPLYPTLDRVPQTGFSCQGREWGLHADTEAYCQAFHLCQDHLVRSFLCPNATLFNDQFKVCDQFYNVRCGSPFEDL